MGPCPLVLRLVGFEVWPVNICFARIPDQGPMLRAHGLDCRLKRRSGTTTLDMSGVLRTFYEFLAEPSKKTSVHSKAKLAETLV